MKAKISHPNIFYKTACFAMLVFSIQACDNLLDVDKPDSRITSEVVFSDDITANSAVAGIYQDMINPIAFSSGSNSSVTSLAGLSADEFVDYYRTDKVILDIEQNNISIDNTYMSGLWSSLYKIVFQANSALEGVRSSTGITPSTRRQLEGETLFIRAFCHFYLVNMFGDVPLVTTTSYSENSQSSRQPVEAVYQQIIDDLLQAKDLLGETFVTIERVRPNKYAASALLARVYLYQSEWQKAEEESTFVIDHSEFELVTDLNSVFKANSREAIWQIMPVIPDFNTWDGYFFAVTFLGPLSVVMNEDLVSSFDEDDGRLFNWVGTYDTGSGLLHFPYKYKADIFTSGTSEYTTVFRLGEQFLIRAEARAKQTNLEGAIEDLDKIRVRAGLSSILDTDPSIQQTELLNVIEHERRIELFSEWGHRWFDLKRNDHATDELSEIKPGWDANDQLYPIPALEFQRNSKLGLQNPGY